MPDRVVTYDFRGNFSNLGAGLVTMGRGVGDLGNKLTALDKNGARARRGLTELGSTAGRAGLVAAVGIGVLVASAANFDQAMSNVAATGDDARGSLDELRQAALDAGAATKFSATEAAAGIENMLKAGVSAEDVLGGGLAGALDLAAAGGLDVATAAEIAATALTQFKLEGEDVPHVADLLAAAAGKAQGDVDDMSMALKQSGLVASQMGVSIEETTGTLAAFASAGLLGSDAGTSFRTMLLRLANPTAESSALMAQLGINAYDASGQFVGMASIAEQLQTAFEGKTQAERDSALATIFGSDAIRAASVLYTQGGEGVADWTRKVDDAGYAAETAAIKMDNLKGDLEELRGALETAFIGAGDGSQGALRDLTQGATDAVNVFNQMPGSVQESTTKLLALVAVTGGAAWFGSKSIQGVANTRQALDDLAASGPKTERALRGVARAGGLLLALEGVDIILDQIGEAAAGSAPGVEQLTAALIDANQANFAETFGGDLAGALNAVDPSGVDQLAKSLDSLGDSFPGGNALVGGLSSFVGLTPQIHEASQQADKAALAFESLDAALTGLVSTGGPERAQQAFDDLAASQGLSAAEQKALLELLPQFEEALAGVANQASLAAEGLSSNPFEWLYGGAAATEDYAAAANESADANTAEAKAINQATQAMRDKRDAAVSGFDAETRWREAVKDATAAAKANNAGIRGSSDAALENRNQLGALAAAWNDQSAAVKNNKARFADARQTFIETATAMGVPKKAAQDLARELLEIPRSTVAKVEQQGAQRAMGDVDELGNALDRLHDKTITLTVLKRGFSNAAGLGVGPGAINETETPRISSRGLTTYTPRAGDLAQAASRDALAALTIFAKETDGAAKGSKGLKERLRHLEERFEKVSKAADRAHDALDDLRAQKAGLESAVTGSISHDPFGGSLEEFQAQTSADAADAAALLAALKQLVANGLDPHSDLFKRLAASGNIGLVQQFAALTSSQLAAEAASYVAGQVAISAPGQYAGQQAFGDLIDKQRKVTERLDGTVHDLAQQIRQLEKAIKDMPGKVRDGAQAGSWAGSEAGSERGTRAGQSDRARNLAAQVRTQPRPLVGR